MSQQNRSTLKNYFRTGQKPTQEQFADLIDSGLNLADDGIFDVGGNMGLGHDNPVSKLAVNGNVSVSPNNDSAPTNGLFVHGNVGIGAGFTSPTAQLAVKGGVYIGNTENTDPGANSLKVDGNIDTAGNLSVAGTLNTESDTTIDGNLTLSDTKYVATDEVRARDSGGLKLYDAGGADGLMIHDSGKVSIGSASSDTDKLHVEGNLRVTSDISMGGNLNLADTKYVATDEVRARDSGGLKLYDAGGADGLMIHDDGNVSIGSASSDTHKLYVKGSLRATGDIKANSLSLTGSTYQTSFKGDHEGDYHNSWTIDVPDNKVVVGFVAKRYRKENGDKDYYTFALRYK